MPISCLDKTTLGQWFEIGPLPSDRDAAEARILAQIAGRGDFGVLRLLVRERGATIGRMTFKTEPRGRLQLWPPVFRAGLAATRKRAVADQFLAEAGGLMVGAPIRYLEARFDTVASDAAVWQQALLDFGFGFIAEAVILERSLLGVETPDCGSIVKGDLFGEAALLDLYLACQTGTADRADADPLISQRDDFMDFLDPSEATADRTSWRVAQVGATPAGLAIPQVDRAGGGWIAYIGVIPLYRRRGIASTLLRTTLAGAFGGSGVIQVMIDRTNRNSLGLHRANGLTDTGRRFLTFRCDAAANLHGDPPSIL